MLYKYSGNKFKINGETVVSDGDVLTITTEWEDNVRQTGRRLKPYTIINNTTGNEIPDGDDFYYRMTTAKLLKPLDTDAGDIDEVEDPVEIHVVDKVNHPSHYTWLKDKCGIEVIDITRHMDFDLGNAIKYILRCGHKSENGYTDKEKMIEDLRKANWYINDKINMLHD